VGILQEHARLRGDKLRKSIYSDVVCRRTHKIDSSKGGWLGFTDKYWAATMIPDQTRAIHNFPASASNGRDVYQTDYLARMPSSFSPAARGYQDQLFAGAKVVKTVQAIGDKYKITKFDLMIDWAGLNSSCRCSICSIPQ
jgi:YidC/Oxa1 family membrane protein insertase